jgi:chromosome condensin MukBEF ATPase and DNA-binding subunit MukB
MDTTRQLILNKRKQAEERLQAANEQLAQFQQVAIGLQWQIAGYVEILKELDEQPTASANGSDIEFEVVEAAEVIPQEPPDDVWNPIQPETAKE